MKIFPLCTWHKNRRCENSGSASGLDRDHERRAFAIRMPVHREHRQAVFCVLYYSLKGCHNRLYHSQTTCSTGCDQTSGDPTCLNEALAKTAPERRTPLNCSSCGRSSSCFGSLLQKRSKWASDDCAVHLLTQDSNRRRACLLGHLLFSTRVFRYMPCDSVQASRSRAKYSTGVLRYLLTVTLD